MDTANEPIKIITLTGVCPRCGDNVSLRINHKTGNEFVGCNSYKGKDNPGCGWTAQYDKVLNQFFADFDKRMAQINHQFHQSHPEVVKAVGDLWSITTNAHLALSDPNKHKEMQ